MKEAGHPIPESMRLALYSFVSQRRKETREKFEERDNREIGVGLEEIIGLADESIENNK